MQKSPIAPRPSWDWPAAILLFMIIQVAAARLVITHWTPNLYFTQTLSAFRVVLGLALGYSQFRPRPVRWLAYIYSLVILPWQMTAAVEAEASFSERLAVVGGRLWFSLGQFFARKPVEDGLFFVALVSIGFWIIALTAGYAQTRHNNTLAVLVPAGVATLIIQLYDSFVPSRIWVLGFYVFLALVYLGRIYLKQNREYWSDQRVLVTAESTQDMGRSLLAVAAVTVFLAWSLPTSISSLKSAAHSWDRMTRPIRERLNNAVSSLESPYGTAKQGDFYGENLQLGRSAAMGDTVVFTVRPNTQLQNEPVRYYWRGRIYDTYHNGRWSNTSSISRDFDPKEQELNLPVSEGIHEEARFIFTIQLSKQGLIYAPADPFWINRPSRFFSVRTPGQGDDITSWVADPELVGGDKYQVRAWVSNPTIEELRAAGTEYPAWVKEHYGFFASSPNDPTLMALAPIALQVTEGKETTYDKVEAITAFLRKEIEYSTSVATPPSNVDPILWFLTDYKKGYCMYSASAEVLMLRSIGIPARLAVGFAQGRYDEGFNTYTVLRRDSHAWPEVYFPGIGWVEFEPTGNQDPLVRPAAPVIAPTPGGETGGNEELGGPLDPFDRESRLDDEGITPTAEEQAGSGRLLLLGISMLFLAVLVAANQRYGLVGRMPALIASSYARSGAAVPEWVKRWESWMYLSAIERSFHAVNYSLNSLGKPQPKHVTPVERAKVLREVLPAAGEQIDILLKEHQASMYTAQPGIPARARAAAWKLVALTWKARIAQAWDDFDSRFNRYG